MYKTMTDLQIEHNKKNMRFEVKMNGELAYLEYRMKGNDIAFMHTEVPEALSGKGIASALAVYAFRYAKENNQPVIVYCPFVKTFLKRHPEYNIQLDPAFTKH
jgi:predicted GNAT family acetyltransferase